MKLIGKKMKMTQVFKDDLVYPVTPVKFDDQADLSVLKEGERIKVSGITKGKGFQGVVKRHGFHGGPQTHGQKNRLRAPGSIGSVSPQRVLPGRRMAGHMGMTRVTTENVLVVTVDNQNKLVLVNGAAPGNVGGKVELRK